MNNFGDFLYNLRKEKHITQIELANKLGVTNKAVSKWETGEAMPEASLLLPIAQIFDVTVDELLKGERMESSFISSKNNESSKDNENYNNYEERNENKKEQESFVLKEHLFTRGKDDKKNETLGDVISGVVCTIIFSLGTISFFILGLVKNLWHPFWVIIPSCAFLCGIVGIVFGLCSREKRIQKFNKGENPFTGAICGILMLLCLITYLCLGAFFNLWHPCWIILVVASLLCGVIGTLGNIGVYNFKNKKENNVDNYKN